MPIPIFYCSAQFATLPSLFNPHSSLSHRLSAATCYPKFLKQSTSSNRTTFTNPQLYSHLHSLVAFFFRILYNTHSSLHNFSSESATSAASSANKRWLSQTCHYSHTTVLEHTGVGVINNHTTLSHPHFFIISMI